MSEPHRLLTCARELAEACERLAEGGAVAVDTEFRREKTYRPELCLIQLAGPDEQVLVDAIEVEDLSPVRELFAEPSVEKVLHSARQDLEIFWQLWEELPRPLFDTQVAAALLGHGDNLGYGAIVKELLGVELDKAHARTDWTRRPLRPEQLAYAADDVIHLVEVHERLAERLEQEGREAWHRAEAERLLDPALYRSDPGQAWRTVKGHRRLRGEERRVLRALAAWREKRAERVDKPRRWVISDDAILALAKTQPTSPRELDRLRELPEGLRRRQGEVLAELIRRTLDGEGPPPETEEPARGRLEAAEQDLIDELLVLVREAAERHGVAAALLAPRADVTALVRDGEGCGVPVLAGWRRELVGEELLRRVRERSGS